MWGTFVRDCLCVWAVIFLMYVIPSVMVQSYICYVTHSWSWTVKIQWLFLKCVESGGESARCFDISSAACLKDGNELRPDVFSIPQGIWRLGIKDFFLESYDSSKWKNRSTKTTQKQFFHFVDQAFSRFSSKPSITQPVFFCPALCCKAYTDETKHSCTDLGLSCVTFQSLKVLY